MPSGVMLSQVRSGPAGDAIRSTVVYCSVLSCPVWQASHSEVLR